MVTASCLFFLVMLKNAWVSEDAFITFRSIEQLFAGNGLRWNPHERVQAFTHPLWLGVLAVFRLVTTDLYISAILASLLACGLAFERGYKIVAGHPLRWAMALLLLFSSRGFVDFSTSGHENPLAHMLLACFLCRFYQAFAPSRRDIGLLTLMMSALLLTRIDLVTLVCIPYALSLLRARVIGWRKLVAPITLGSLPLATWTLFSLLYYGLPVPNTALAKLNTGIPASAMYRHGLMYLKKTAVEDPVTVFVLGGAIFVCIYAFVRKPIPERRGISAESAAGAAVVLGIALNLLYVVLIGGDFMMGRFHTSAYFAAVIVFARGLPSPRAGLSLAVVASALVAITQPYSPIRTGFDYQNAKADSNGIGDERGVYFQSTSLYQWWKRDPSIAFPDHGLTRQWLELKELDRQVFRRTAIGMMGYAIGTEKIIVDPLALTDPLAARLLSRRTWRIGHYLRDLPAGYYEGVGTGRSGIKDPELREFHQRL